MNYSKKISSPLGALYLVSNDCAIISLDTSENDIYINAISAYNHDILNLCHLQLDEYFSGIRTSFQVPIDPTGTLFQKKVWNALLEIPFGTVWTYKEQANYLENPKACRAVGSANGKNPIPIIIPCHRVIGSNAQLIGYSAGLKMKEDLLKHEGHHFLHSDQNTLL